MNRNSLNILLVEDDFGDRVIVERTLEKCEQEIALTHCECLQQALDELVSVRHYDVMLLDLSLPDSFGLSALEKIRHCSLAIPVVVLTGLNDNKLALQALEKGAQDYLVKGSLDDRLLERTLRYSIQRQQIQLENHRLLAEMELLARSDALTGVLNRHSFEENLEREWRLANRYNKPLSCIVLDIDYFKRINDTWGHAAGDTVLKRIAESLQQCTRETDFVGRLGGEEFGLLLPETDERDAIAVAERIREGISQLNILVDADTKLAPTVSAGVAQLNEQMSRPETLVDCADKAMFVAKQHGRDRVAAHASLFQDAGGANSSVAWKGLSVESLMCPIVHSVKRDQSVGEVMDRMHQFGNDALPVLDDNGSLLGVIDESVLLNATLNETVFDGKADDVMKTQIVTFPLDAPAKEVCEFLCRSSQNPVYILDDRHPVGVIRRLDFIHWFQQANTSVPG